MRKLASHVKNVAKCLLFLGCIVQIGYGLIWTFHNIGERTHFAGVGISFLEEYYIVVYAVQLICAFLAGAYFLRTLRQGQDAKWVYGFGSLVLMTIPQALQCHLAVLPYSLMSSALLVWFSLALRYFRKNGKRGGYIVAIIGSIVVMHAVCMVPAYSGADTAISREDTILVSVTSRVSAPFLQEDYFNMPQEIKDWIDSDIIVGATSYGDGIATQLYPITVERYGRDAARSALRDVIRYEIGFNTRKIVEYIGLDIISYHVTAVMNYLQLEGMGYDSMASRNYLCLSLNAPQTAKGFVTYWAVSFVLFSVATVIVLVIEKRKISWKNVWLFLLPIEYGILLFTMQGSGLMDYKKTVFVTLVAYSVMFMALLPERGESVE